MWPLISKATGNEIADFQYFACPTWLETDGEAFLRLLQELATPFKFGPFLRILSGCIPPIPKLTARTLAAALLALPKLETVNVSKKLVKESGCRSKEECALQLA